jgi:hypothetical protein
MDMEKFPSVFGVHLVFGNFPWREEERFYIFFLLIAKEIYVYLLIGVRPFSCLKK